MVSVFAPKHAHIHSATKVNAISMPNLRPNNINSYMTVVSASYSKLFFCIISFTCVVYKMSSSCSRNMCTFFVFKWYRCFCKKKKLVSLALTSKVCSVVSTKKEKSDALQKTMQHTIWTTDVVTAAFWASKWALIVATVMFIQVISKTYSINSVWLWIIWLGQP